jgi:hypothetical protein
MKHMSNPHFRVLARLASVTILIASLVPALAFQTDMKRGRKYVPPPPMMRIEVTVIRASSGKPIPNAAVIFHPMEGDKDKGNMELKTNEDGKAVIDVLTKGSTVRLQVIATGFQTYGEDYQMDMDEKQIIVKMKRPSEQYSVYKPHPENAQPDPPAATPAPQPPKPDAKQ